VECRERAAAERSDIAAKGRKQTAST
jgi:hypothetical protein